MSTSTTENPKMEAPKIVSQEEWLAASERLLADEKRLTRERDALAAKRRRMPWLAVEKHYEFDSPHGKVSLLDLFPSPRPRHHPRLRFARAAARYRTPQGAHGLDDALVHHHRQL